VTSYYYSSISKFLQTTSNEIIGILAKSQSQDVHLTVEIAQMRSWMNEVKLLKETLSTIALEPTAGIILEYFIPRRAKRIDTVILTHNIIFVLEFKNNAFVEMATSYKQNDLHQYEDSALELRDFHKESRERVILPILIYTSAKVIPFKPSLDQVKNIIAVNNKNSLIEEINRCIAVYGSTHDIDLSKWESSALRTYTNNY